MPAEVHTGPVDDKDAVFFHLHFREPSLQFTRTIPMDRRSSSVE
jgi:hypothetical protein